MRLEAGLTQAQLASRLKVHQTRVSKVEVGERRIDILELQLWCEALGMSLRDFVARMERRRP
jgi:transcriptional regulator with XRE-family HTH domain